MLNFPGVGRGAGTTVESPFMLRSFSTISRFFNFLTFFFNYLAVATCSCLLLEVFSTPILLPPFAGCQSAFSQNHGQNVNEVLLTGAVTTLLIGKTSSSTGYNQPPFNQSQENYWGGQGPPPPSPRSLSR